MKQTISTKNISLLFLLILITSCSKENDINDKSWTTITQQDGNSYIESTIPIELTYTDLLTSKTNKSEGTLRAYKNNTYTISFTPEELIPINPNSGIGFKINCFNENNDHLINEYKSLITDYKQRILAGASMLDSEQRRLMKEQLDKKLEMFNLRQTNITYSSGLIKDQTFNVYGNELLLEMEEHKSVTCYGYRYKQHFELGQHHDYMDEDWDVIFKIDSKGFKEAFNSIKN